MVVYKHESRNGSTVKEEKERVETKNKREQQKQEQEKSEPAELQTSSMCLFVLLFVCSFKQEHKVARDHDKEQHHLGHVFIGLLMYCRKQNPKKRMWVGRWGGGQCDSNRKQQQMSPVGRQLQDTGGEQEVSD